MFLIISFDGREAVIKNPTDKLCSDVVSHIGDSERKRQYLGVGENCDEILVFPGKHAGIITEMYISYDSISAVRSVSPTSSGKG